MRALRNVRLDAKPGGNKTTDLPFRFALLVGALKDPLVIESAQLEPIRCRAEQLACPAGAFIGPFRPNNCNRAHGQKCAVTTVEAL